VVHDVLSAEALADAERSDVRAHFLLVEPDHGGLSAIVVLVDAGPLHAEVASLPFEDVAKTHEFGETGHTTGKLAPSDGVTGLRTLVRGDGPNEVAGGPERTGCTSSSAAGVFDRKNRSAVGATGVHAGPYERDVEKGVTQDDKRWTAVEARDEVADGGVSSVKATLLKREGVVVAPARQPPRAFRPVTTPHDRESREEISMSNSVFHSTVMEGWSAAHVWAVVRDFNSYPIWVNGVDESHIEGDLPGTAVGVVRNFRIGDSHTRQRLLAHSDVDRFFTYESCEPFKLEEHGHDRSLVHYQGTLRISPITDGNRSFVEWSAEYECSAEDATYWNTWWTKTPPEWLESLRAHLARSQDWAG
jgi:hypothetical protein